MAPRTGNGRPARYCKRAHRQRAYEARRRADQADLAVDQFVVTKADLDRLHDRLYALEAALEDIEGDLAGTKPTLAAYQGALDHLAAAAGDLRGVVLEPVIS